MKTLSLAALFLFSLGALAQTTTYKVDPSHTSAVFRIDHMGFSPVMGIIGGADGKIVVDEKDPSKSTFEVSLKVDTLNTLDKKRDEHLRSPDFFNAKQFPTINLKSKSVKKNGDKFDIVADLTLHGVTKPVSFTFTQMKTGKDPWGKVRTGGEAVLNIKRSEYAMTYMNKPGEVGDNVEIRVSIEAVK